MGVRFSVALCGDAAALGSPTRVLVKVDGLWNSQAVKRIVVQLFRLCEIALSALGAPLASASRPACVEFWQEGLLV